MKTLLILILISFVICASSKGMSNSCQSLLQSYFDNKSHIAQIVVIKPNGQVVVSRDGMLLYPYGGFLTNTAGFYSVFSDLDRCFYGNEQPFDIEKKKPSYFDRSGIVIYQNGTLSMYPTWDHSLTCQLSCQGSTFQGWTDDDGHYLTIQFIDGAKKLDVDC